MAVPVKVAKMPKLFIEGKMNPTAAAVTRLRHALYSTSLDSSTPWPVNQDSHVGSRDLSAARVQDIDKIRVPGVEDDRHLHDNLNPAQPA